MTKPFASPGRESAVWGRRCIMYQDGTVAWVYGGGFREAGRVPNPRPRRSAASVAATPYRPREIPKLGYARPHDGPVSRRFKL